MLQLPSSIELKQSLSYMSKCFKRCQWLRGVDEIIRQSVKYHSICWFLSLNTVFKLFLDTKQLTQYSFQELGLSAVYQYQFSLRVYRVVEEQSYGALVRYLLIHSIIYIVNLSKFLLLQEVEWQTTHFWLKPLWSK